MIVQASAARLPLADDSVHCVVTSPPYWGLRRYDGERQAQCWPDGWVGQLGLEPSPWAYIEHLVDVMREVRRSLRPDGSLWLNLGDAYANDGKCGGESGGKQAYLPDADGQQWGRSGRRSGMAAKNLLGLPWRVALALQADGWVLRSEIIWHKTTPMPESVRDRPTRAHEHIFLLAKSARYYYDDIGSREPAAGTAHARGAGEGPKAVSASSAVRLPRSPAAQTTGRIRSKQNASFSAAVSGLVTERRQRSVWAIGGDPYRGAHYACFPRELARRCIVAGTSERGVCARCGQPWVRVVERQRVGDWTRNKALRAQGISTNRFTAKVEPGDGAAVGNLAASRQEARERSGQHDGCFRQPRAIGWRASCTCGAEPVPAIVLDPFGGSGTVGEVAAMLGRRAVLVDVAYQQLQRERVPALLALAEAAGGVGSFVGTGGV
ncbi:MAG: DNA-methyltransferase [Terriglobales bacterium]